ncbi:MAG: SusD/RagB family nutrient-binding outer membrane lipoprotein [Gemmatimonadaceae bacterium]
MKLNRLTVAIVTLLSVTLASCETDLTGINTNPNSPTTAPAGTLFSQATINAIGRFSGSGQLSGSALMAQHLAQVQYIDEDRGHIRTTTIDAMYANAYISELEDFQKVIELGQAASAPNTWGPALIMQSWTYQNMTDIWGDIPYSQALKGDVVGGSLKPAYDPQKDIYYGLLASLTSASTAMATATDAGLGSADLVFDGNSARWVRFANTLRARMAMRMLKNDATKAATELTAAFAAGVMTSNSDNAVLAYPGDGVFDNGYAATFATRDDHRVSKTLLDTMNALGDPRVFIYAQPTRWDPSTGAPWADPSTARAIGLQNGLNNATVTPFFNTTSRVGAMFYPGATSYGTFGTAAGKQTPAIAMTYAEAEFLMAEAAERGLGGQTGAAAHYNAGVTASILQWGGTAADAAAYLAQPGVAYVAGVTGLQQIGLQKWISLFTQGNEAWAEWRRTGNPNTVAMGPSAYPDVLAVPRRWPYASTEQSVNAESWAAAVAAQGADNYATRMWWDK